MPTNLRIRSRSHAAGAKVVALHRPSDTRERVLQVARALFAERGYRGTSLRDIARRIGIKAPSLLHHFPSKQQLYLAVLDSIFEGMEDATARVLSGPGDRHQRARVVVTGAID
ncbi:MAG TPA: helix-turn-helix domain-containing protein, partial [Candidatus Binataceae bacterium]|nr:helix-turn-helix domain-containing protein [Candidatus Binataceae bacterium]